jgi:hypothetical protein
VKSGVQFSKYPLSFVGGYLVSRKLTQEQFIERSRAVHKDQYDYQLVEYITNKDHISIVCPIHGIFDQRPDHHLAGQGCPMCSREKRLGGYTEELFRIKPEIKELPGLIYFIKFESDCETFYKIGITSRSVEERFKKKGDIAHYTIEVIATKAMTLYEAYQLEQQLLTDNSHLKYMPQKWFSGWTECLSLDDLELHWIKSFFA